MTTRQFLLFILVISSHVSLGQHKQKVKYDYLLYLPKDYAKKSKKYPLLIYLHGGSQKEMISINSKLMAYHTLSTKANILTLLSCLHSVQTTSFGRQTIGFSYSLRKFRINTTLIQTAFIVLV
jgi:hypothetical protein